MNSKEQQEFRHLLYDNKAFVAILVADCDPLPPENIDPIYFLPKNYTYQDINRYFASRFLSIRNSPKQASSFNHSVQHYETGEQMNKKIVYDMKEVMSDQFKKYDLCLLTNYFNIGSSHTPKNSFIESCILNILKDPRDSLNYWFLSRLFAYQNKVQMLKFDAADIDFIKIMIKHSQIKQTFYTIDQLQKPNIDEVGSEIITQEILKNLEDSSYPFLRIPNFASTTHKGEIFFSSFLLPIEEIDQHSQIRRLLRLVTIIHHVFCNFRKIKYFQGENLLDFNQQCQIGDQQYKEAGRLMQTKLFGKVIDHKNLTEEFLTSFFMKESWKNSIDFAQLLNQNMNKHIKEPKLLAPKKVRRPEPPPIKESPDQPFPWSAQYEREESSDQIDY